MVLTSEDLLYQSLTEEDRRFILQFCGQPKLQDSRVLSSPRFRIDAWGKCSKNREKERLKVTSLSRYLSNTHLD
jgi:hypothetical protein